ncbi:hypothetical protein JY96_11615 [Aquabacterium sp. NJ1]|uniref:hypothetical protein n=1 Tax=Aquabacterium sp. NJ1 TaxID=1538295 RepID=UPI00052D961C|nr:hypothetical protein [Aquabacterium sp. NJ1]KGM40470.1 hypothetical protein JY96_11615 [Aquabacterium sp. NJ1]
MRTLTANELNAVSGAALTLPTVGATNDGLTFTTNGKTTTVSWKQVITIASIIYKLASGL